MSSQFAAVLVAFIFLHFKHFVCDFPLQSDYQMRTKRIYGHPGGLTHAALHALATVPVFTILRPPIGMALAIIVTEFLLHYHIDWLKEKILASQNLDTGDRNYWRTIGIDQMLHNFNYVGIIAVTNWQLWI